MKKLTIAAGIAAALFAANTAVADDVTIINRDSDTTGSIVIKKPKPRVVVRDSPTIVVKEQRSEPKIVIKDNDPDLVVKEKRKKIVID
ncbi:MAG: hypothetical protein KL863_09325 [Rhizobium sp.]|nr:hypothetical protein [Rhizobium sp.]